MAAVLPALLLGEETQPTHFGREYAVTADKSLLVSPPPEIRKLRVSHSSVFESPTELRVWNSRRVSGPLLLLPGGASRAKEPIQPPEPAAGSGL